MTPKPDIDPQCLCGHEPPCAHTPFAGGDYRPSYRPPADSIEELARLMWVLRKDVAPLLNVQGNGVRREKGGAA